MRKGVLRNFAKFRGKHLCQSLFFNKVADLRQRCDTVVCDTLHRLKLATLLKVILLHGCFSRFLNRANGTKTRKTSHF